MNIVIMPNRQRIIIQAAEFLVAAINEFEPSHNKPFVLGLSTGATVLSICGELVRQFEMGKISFEHVVIFTAGEYLGVSEVDKDSYSHRIYHDFFSKVNLPSSQIFTLNGQSADINQECIHYEELIQKYGGLELFLGSLGENGNLAFNEPGSALLSSTRLKTLNNETIRADARFFHNNIAKVPTQALTIGIKTIYDASKILIVVYGTHKAFAVRQCLEQEISAMHPASFLQLHPHTTFMIDKVAGRKLSLDQTFSEI